MSTLALKLTNADIKSRVQSSNSFTKEEIALYRPEIRLARAEKREQLATVTGSQLGTMVEGIMKENNATITDMKSRIVGKQQKWTITLAAKANQTEAERLEAQAAKLQKQMENLKKKQEALAKPVATVATA